MLVWPPLVMWRLALVIACHCAIEFSMTVWTSESEPTMFELWVRLYLKVTVPLAQWNWVRVDAPPGVDGDQAVAAGARSKSSARARERVFTCCLPAPCRERHRGTSRAPSACRAAPLRG